jgi:PAS domain-containing protein
VARCSHPDDLQRHGVKWRASVASGEPHESEVRFRGADGEYRWHLDRGFPLRAEDGNIIKWYGIVTGIEDRKRVEEALRRNEHCLAEAQRLSHVGSFGMEVKTRRIFWSEESARIYGYPPGAKPTPELILQRVHPEDVGLVTDAIKGAGLGGDDLVPTARLLKVALQKLTHALQVVSKCSMTSDEVSSKSDQKLAAGASKF